MMTNRIAYSEGYVHLAFWRFMGTFTVYSWLQKLARFIVVILLLSLLLLFSHFILGGAHGVDASPPAWVGMSRGNGDDWYVLSGGTGHLAADVVAVW